MIMMMYAWYGRGWYVLWELWWCETGSYSPGMWKAEIKSCYLGEKWASVWFILVVGLVWCLSRAHGPRNYRYKTLEFFSGDKIRPTENMSLHKHDKVEYNLGISMVWGKWTSNTLTTGLEGALEGSRLRWQDTLPWPRVSGHSGYFPTTTTGGIGHRSGLRSWRSEDVKDILVPAGGILTLTCWQENYLLNYSMTCTDGTGTGTRLIWGWHPGVGP